MNEFIAMLHPNTNTIALFDGDSDYLAPATYDGMKFWLHHPENGIFGYSSEETCKYAAKYFGVDYYTWEGSFGYFHKGAWV
jgi:hypothetical protein